MARRSISQSGVLKRSGEPYRRGSSMISMLPRAQERVRLDLLGLGQAAGLLDRARRGAAVYPSGMRRKEPTVIRRGRSARRALFHADHRASAGSRIQGLSTLSFISPRRVSVCVSRSVRRGVLFAQGIAGGSVGRGKKWRRNFLSNYSCK